MFACPVSLLCARLVTACIRGMVDCVILRKLSSYVISYVIFHMLGFILILWGPLEYFHHDFIFRLKNTFSIQQPTQNRGCLSC